jgi:hypothetical protein
MSRKGYGSNPARFASEELTRRAIKRQPPGAAFGPNPPPTKIPVRGPEESGIVNDHFSPHAADFADILVPPAPMQGEDL